MSYDAPQAKRKPMVSRRRAQPSPLMRVLLAALSVLIVVLLCACATQLMPMYEDIAAVVSADTSAEELADPAPTPQPTPTPTAAVYAPFGAQYGFGGAELIPETPTPDPAITPTPSPTPTPTATPETVRTLKKGSTGADVTKLQQALIELGYLSGEADGSFGTNTQDAVILFQAVNGLSADGLAGTKTLTLLYSGEALSADQAPSTDSLLLVNRDNPLDKDFVPADLVSIESVIPSSVVKVKYSGTKANKEAVQALYTMLEAAIADGVSNFQISSAYRSYSEQQKLVDNSISTYKKNNPSWSTERCLSATYQTVAPAGTSEHQSGLAFDITVPGVSFSGTTQQKWLHAHCAEYGFIVRFTEEKQSITGFLAESWHFRYVGVEAAQIMTQSNWCLEEYIEKLN